MECSISVTVMIPVVECFQLGFMCKSADSRTVQDVVSLAVQDVILLVRHRLEQF